MNERLGKILADCHTGRPAVMGILNVTPDSFSDGGCFDGPAEAVSRASEMIAQGADIIDIGAESTRPGSDGVSPDQQIARIEKILPDIVRLGAPVSIDTTSSLVARFALDAGAAIINDISAGRDDPDVLKLAADTDSVLILMHMLGKPRTMQKDPHYSDVSTEVRDFLLQQVAAAQSTGLQRDNCIIDPGIGFGKTLEHNLALLATLTELVKTGLTVLMGASRKSFIAAACGNCPANARLGGSIAAACHSYLAGARIFRVHDIAQTRQALDLLAAIQRSG